MGTIGVFPRRKELWKNTSLFMSRKTKLKCAGVIGLAFVGSLLASLWPVQLGELYNGISDGAIGTLAGGRQPLPCSA